NRLSGEKAPVARSSRSQTERAESVSAGRLSARTFHSRRSSPVIRRSTRRPPYGGIGISADERGTLATGLLDVSNERPPLHWCYSGEVWEIPGDRDGAIGSRGAPVGDRRSQP